MPSPAFRARGFFTGEICYFRRHEEPELDTEDYDRRATEVAASSARRQVLVNREEYQQEDAT
jgi:hypothetical protein